MTDNDQSKPEEMIIKAAEMEREAASLRASATEMQMQIDMYSPIVRIAVADDGNILVGAIGKGHVGSVVENNHDHYIVKIMKRDARPNPNPIKMRPIEIVSQGVVS